MDIDIDAIVRIVQGQQIEIDELKDKVFLLEEKLSPPCDYHNNHKKKIETNNNSEYYSVREYANKIRMRINNEGLKKIGGEAFKMCQKRSISIKKYSLKEYGSNGSINTYPEKVLKKVFDNFKPL